MEHQSDVMPLLNETTTRSRSRSRRSFADIMRHDEMMRKIQGANEVDRRRSGALTNFDRREHRQLDDGGRSAGPASPPPARPRYYPRPPSHPPIAAATDNVQPATLSINPAEASDVTVHLSLDVHENLENTLEEMSRLRRLGHFKKALSLAEVEVKPFLRNRYVLVQYAQLLMDAGRYKDIARLSVDHVPVKHPPNAIELNWTMICQWVEVTTELDITGCTGVLRSGYKSGPLTSTDLEVILLSIRATRMDDRPLPKWQTIYRVLHQDGRIWEARDLIEALLEVIGPRDLLAHLFPLSHDSIREYGDDLVNVYLNMLLQQWDAASTGLQSESKLLALMSIFTNLAMEFSRIFDTRRWGPASLIMAREAAEKLVAQHGAHNIYTRPFLRFLVVEAMMASLISSNDVLHNMLFESGARGETVYEYGLGFPSYLLPLYEPSEAETPIWAPRRNEEVIKILHTVFGSAEQMGDAGLQIGCLTQLIMYGEHDAVRLVDDLGRLYLEAGNFVGQRNSLLFSYLLARTKEEKKALRGLILESGRYVFRENDNFTRDKILEALEDQGHVEHGLNERPLRRRRYMNEYDDDDSDDDFSDYSLEYEDRSYSHPPPPRIRKSDSQHYAPSSSPPPPRPIPIKTGSDVVQQYIPVSDYYPRKSAPPVRRRPTSFGPDNNSFSYGVGPLVIYDKHKSRPSRHSTSYYDEDNYGEIHEPDKDRVRTVNSDELEEISRRGRDDGQDMIVRRSDVSRSRSRATKAYATLQPTAEQVYLDGLDARAHRFEEMADPEKDAARNEVIREVHRHEEARREDETSRSEEAPGDEPWRKEARLQALREQERRMDTERQEATSLGQTPPDIESLPEAEREAIRKDIEAHEDAVATYVRRETDERANGHTIDSTGSAAALATIAEEVPNGRTTASESVDD